MLHHVHMTAENIPSKARYTDKDSGVRRTTHAVKGREALREIRKGGAGLALSMTQRVTEVGITDNKDKSKFVTLVYYKGEHDFVTGRLIADARVGRSLDC